TIFTQEGGQGAKKIRISQTAGLVASSNNGKVTISQYRGRIKKEQISGYDFDLTSNGQYLAISGYDKGLKILSKNKQYIEIVKPETWENHLLDFSDDNQWLVTADSHQDHRKDKNYLLQIRLWKIGENLTAMKEPIHIGNISRDKQKVFYKNCFGFSGNGEWIYATNLDTLHLWKIDLKKKNPVKSYYKLEHDGTIVSDISISTDGHWLITGAYDYLVRLWDLEKIDYSKQPVILTGHTHLVKTVAIDNNGRYAASGGLDGNVRLWDLHSQHPSSDAITLYRSEPVTDVIFSNDGKWLIAAYEDGSIRRWSVNIDSLKAVARQAVGRTFSDKEKIQFIK
ncbi:MAG: hypothetical protein D3922_11180, partial [Candidatus Electrothrix sp. AR1]|nr:hypothetical protein [Candidatus Electrothrix sp. AR1]